MVAVPATPDAASAAPPPTYSPRTFRASADRATWEYPGLEREDGGGDGGRPGTA